MHALAAALERWERPGGGLTGVLRSTAQAFGWTVAIGWLVDEDRALLRCREIWVAAELEAEALEQALARELVCRRGQGTPAGLVWEGLRPLGFGGGAPTMRPVPAAAHSLAGVRAEAGLRGGAALPVIDERGLLGCLELYGPEPPPASKRFELTLAALGRQLGDFLGRRGAELWPSPLTAREREVLQLAASGASTPAIADELVLSQSTVKTHFEHIYEKLGVRDRAAAVAQALRRGLIA